MEPYFFNRDLSWLSFNERVLMEAERDTVPLMERIRFLAIYSSNLDEFYRVRIPTLMVLTQIKALPANASAAGSLLAPAGKSLLEQANDHIDQQLQRFGALLRNQLLPALQQTGNELLYHTPIPAVLEEEVSSYFLSQVLCFVQPVWLEAENPTRFFPANHQLYLLVLLQKENSEQQVILNIPSQQADRFLALDKGGKRYILFLEDILKQYLPILFTGYTITGAYSFKITRDAELNLEDEYEGDVAAKMEKQLHKRDLGIATRFLYQPGIPLRSLNRLLKKLNLTNANIVEGGFYHNLKDLADLPVRNASALSYTRWPSLQQPLPAGSALLDHIRQKDLVLHVPYQSYDPVLRFFNEAATAIDVTEIYITLYRVAKESKIVSALISAAQNGKKVVVFVELKARFDEENNLKWAKRMKAAGVQIIYSIPGLKVHAKTALVKRASGKRTHSLCLLSTGNFNEGTARFYTDHVLFTADTGFARELELLFLFLGYRKQADQYPNLQFNHLLVAQFNLQQRFLEMIDREIQHARQGKTASILLKLNNLEEQVLIRKLYEASNAGVQVQVIVRSICCLVPGIPGMSENIRLVRIVDRYLEHGRLAIFHNNGETDMYLGSADWMNRNIYRRIEVCFPIRDTEVKQQLLHLVQLQLKDTRQAVELDQHLNNVPAGNDGPSTFSAQEGIYEYLRSRQDG